MSRPRSIDLTHVSEWQDGRLRRFQDYLVGEEPLEIRVGKFPLSVTMRTPGHDLELAAGFLFAEGLIERREQILSLECGQPGAKTRQAGDNVVHVRLKAGLWKPERSRRNFVINSSCGVCGKASIEAV